jgi:hypothetical protein
VRHKIVLPALSTGLVWWRASFVNRSLVDLIVLCVRVVVPMVQSSSNLSSICRPSGLHRIQLCPSGGAEGWNFGSGGGLFSGQPPWRVGKLQLVILNVKEAKTVVTVADQARRCYHTKEMIVVLVSFQSLNAARLVRTSRVDDLRLDLDRVGLRTCAESFSHSSSPMSTCAGMFLLWLYVL